MRGFSTFEQAVDVRLVRRQGSLVRVYRRKGTMDDGQPTLLNRRASPFDRVLKTEIFRRGELSLFLATARARARRASAKFSLLSSFLFSFLSFFYFLLRNARVWRTFRERVREKKREKGGGKKRERKNRREVYFGRNRSASDSIGLATRYPAIIFAVIG